MRGAGRLSAESLDGVAITMFLDGTDFSGFFDFPFEFVGNTT